MLSLIFKNVNWHYPNLMQFCFLCKIFFVPKCCELNQQGSIYFKILWAHHSFHHFHPSTYPLTAGGHSWRSFLQSLAPIPIVGQSSLASLLMVVLFPIFFFWNIFDLKNVKCCNKSRSTACLTNLKYCL